MSKYAFPKDRVFITPSLLRVRYGGDFNPNLFKKWQDERKLVKIRNGLYLNKQFSIHGEVDRYMIANQLYSPSYVSLYSALHYYSLIPEHVYEVISVTSRKTNQFESDGTTYSYRHIQPSLFFGYEAVPWKGGAYTIAHPEKALLDLAYFEPQFSDKGWLEEMRFDYWGLSEDLSWDLMWSYADLFNSDTIYQRIALLLETYDL